MQTFLPYPSFRESGDVLDSRRLGKQRVETLQILRALEFAHYGWQNHPAVRMWRGWTDALVRYGLDITEAWTARGHGDTTAEQIAEFAPHVSSLDQDELGRAGGLPPWLGDPQLHLSHQSQLIGKDPAYYRLRFPDCPLGLPYLWPPAAPPPDPPTGSTGMAAPAAAAAAGAAGGRRRLWVLRAESDAALGESLRTGVAGFGAATGVSRSAAGLDLVALAALHGDNPRRPSRAVRALAELVWDVEVGDELAVAPSAGASLIVGLVTSDYAYLPGGHVTHRRQVAWARVLARSSLPRPARLQDVRPLFSLEEGPSPAAPHRRS